MNYIKDQHYNKFLNALYGKDISQKPLTEEFSEECFMNAPVDVRESEKNYRLTINFGIQKFSSIQIKVHHNLLTIEAIPLSFKSGLFTRSFLLPENVDEERITGKWVEECLLIDLPLGNKSIQLIRELSISVA